jgi:flagellar motor switch protein FliG
MVDLATLPETEELTRAQKAAAVLLAVGPDAASQVMQHFSEHEAEQVALEVATMGRLPAEQLEIVLAEFQAEAVAHQHLVAGGEHLAREMLRKLRPDADEIVDRLLASVATTPFHFLRLHDPQEVVQHLREEHSQTIALVLAHLPTRFAATLLSGFDPEVQADVARRVATLERTAPEVIASVERALEERLGAVQRHRSAGRGGVKELATILNSSDRTTERAIMRELEVSDPALAEEVRARMFVFEDIVHLDDRAIQEVMRKVDLKRLALALKSVPPVVVETIHRNLSERARQTLDEEVELLGPVRIRDVEAAQTEVVRIIRSLEEDGSIVIARGGEGEFVA